MARVPKLDTEELIGAEVGHPDDGHLKQGGREGEGTG